MPDIRHHESIDRELDYGESAEVGIIRRWSKSKLKLAREADQIVKTGAYAPFDFLVLDRRGFPIAYLEVKRRRTPFARYGDAMCPLLKHTTANELDEKHAIPAFLVTEYACGTLVQVALTERPKQKKDVARRDRPGMKPIPHAFYVRDQLTVLVEPK